MFANQDEPNLGYLKSMFVGMVAARLGAHRPISVAAIVEATGLSRATVYNCLNQCVGLTKISNYAMISIDSKEDVVYVQQNLMSEGKMMYRVAHKDGSTQLIKRLPNAYSLDHDRAHVKKRPGALKAMDAENAMLCERRKYGGKGKSKGQCELVESTTLPGLGRVRLWQDKGQLPISINGPKTRTHVGATD